MYAEVEELQDRKCELLSSVDYSHHLQPRLQPVSGRFSSVASYENHHWCHFAAHSTIKEHHGIRLVQYRPEFEYKNSFLIQIFVFRLTPFRHSFWKIFNSPWNSTWIYLSSPKFFHLPKIWFSLSLYFLKRTNYILTLFFIIRILIE